MTARTRWTLISALFRGGNVLGVSVLIAFSHGDMERRLVPGYEQDQRKLSPAPAPTPPMTPPAKGAVHTAALDQASP